MARREISICKSQINKNADITVKNNRTLMLIFLVKSSTTPIAKVGIEQRSMVISADRLWLPFILMSIARNKPTAIDNPPIRGTILLCTFCGPDKSTSAVKWQCMLLKRIMRSVATSEEKKAVNSPIIFLL